ncbi:MFS transporter [Luteipulveratus flavus]|uniref:MFS transporter n=1 Tax=Luteipulveratus flavus TaxID=3031728 RepID=A0ABT6C3T0_9MICO|nr:MFS transporter [Luteipulveratus sp. YIM 133296]MDF8263218.1 MFS transporter [Luteipulveratus sp. YIM 133296]
MTAPTSAPSRVRRTALPRLLFAVALANMAYTVLVPFVPLLADRFDMSPLQIGVAFGGFAAAKAVVQPFGGRLVDRWGGLPVSVGGLCLAATATLALATSTNATSIVAFRVLWGIGEGFAMPGLYQLTSQLGQRSSIGRAKALGRFGAAAVIGMTAGPGLVAAFSGTITFKTAFIIGAAMTYLSAALILTERADLTQDNPDSSSSKASDDGPTGNAGTSQQKILLAALALGAADLFNNFIYAALEPIYPLHLSEVLHASQTTIEVTFFCGLGIFAIGSFFAGALVERWGARRSAAAAFIVQTVALLIGAIAAMTGMFVTSFFVVMAAQPIVYVALRTSVTQLTEGHEGTAFGWFGLASDIGWILGPIVAGALFQGLHRNVLLVLAAVTIAGLITTWRATTMQPGPAAQPPC